MRTIKTNEQGYNMKTQPLHRSKRMKKKDKDINFCVLCSARVGH